GPLYRPPLAAARPVICQWAPYVHDSSCCCQAFASNLGTWAPLYPSSCGLPGPECVMGPCYGKKPIAAVSIATL
ncbi:unnamed protein product, partial [Staurois parvus]